MGEDLRRLKNMIFEPFHKYCPDIAEKETRTFKILRDPVVPDGDYGLVDLYCSEHGCDCRRAYLVVFSREKKKALAEISFGWEDEAFYAHWSEMTDTEDLKKLKGPSLNSWSPHQSEWVPALLEIVSGMLERDRDYVERIKKHYDIFKKVVENQRERGLRSLHD